jgi:hypothetical protein
MMKLKSPIMVGVVTAALFAGLAAAPSPAPVDPLAAVSKATPSTVAAAANVATTDVGANAIAATIGKTQVTIPTNASAGVKLGSSGASITVGLPFSGRASHAVKRRNGVVSYDNNNGSITVPVITNDGSVQINTVVQNANAPTRYAYPIDMPAGQTLQLNAADGSAYVASADGSASVLIAAPWAKDANGNAVPTHYEVNGNTLTQVIDFTSETAFPVVAGPTTTWLWWGRTAKYNKSETKQIVSFTSAAQMFSYLCIIGGLAGAACTTAANLGLQIVKNAAQNALKAGRCIQLNIPYVGLGLIYDVKR